MPIEKSERSHWRAKPKTVALESGHREVIRRAFGTVDVLSVDTPDAVTVTRAYDAIHQFPHRHEREAIKFERIRPFPLDVYDAVIGRREIILWTTPETATQQSTTQNE